MSDIHSNGKPGNGNGHSRSVAQRIFGDFLRNHEPFWRNEWESFYVERNKGEGDKCNTHTEERFHFLYDKITFERFNL